MNNKENITSGGKLLSVFDTEKRGDSQVGCGSSAYKERTSHFLPMIEQPPATLRKVNNLFADVQSADSVTLPYAASSGSATGIQQKQMEPTSSNNGNQKLILLS